MSTIEQVISTFDTDLPDKDLMTSDAFDVAAELWVDYQDGLVTELNTLTPQINTVAGEVSANTVAAEAAKDAAVAAANFKGAWSSLTGALAVPASVSNDNEYWMLLTNLADVTASEPSTSNIDWQLLQTMGIVEQAKTADYAIAAVDMLAGNRIFTNEGASGAIEFDLPTRADNYRCEFMVTEAQYLKVSPPSGEKIYFNGQESAVDGYIRSNVVGVCFEITGTSNLGYHITKLIGVVSVDE